MASASFLEATGASVGDTFTLISITQEQSDEFGFDVPEPAGPTLEATLVGMVEEGPADLEGGTPLAVFPTASLDAGDIGVAATVMAAGLTPGSTVDDLRDQLDVLGGWRRVSVSPRTSGCRARSAEAVDAQAQGLIVLAAVVAGAAVVVVGQLLSRQIPPVGGGSTGVELGRFQPGASCRRPRRAGGGRGGCWLGARGGRRVRRVGCVPLDFAARVEPEPGRRVDLLGHALGPVVLAGALLLVGPGRWSRWRSGGSCEASERRRRSSSGWWPPLRARRRRPASASRSRRRAWVDDRGLRHCSGSPW